VISVESGVCDFGEERGLSLSLSISIWFPLSELWHAALVEL